MKRKFQWKRVVVIIIAALLAYSAVSFGITALVYHAIFARYDIPVETPAQLEDFVSQRQLHSFESGQNLLQGYLYPCENADGLIVVAPGYRAGADDYLWQIRELTELGWSVFIFDPTGTRNSQGRHAVGFSQSLLDLNAAIKYIENQQRFGYNDLVLLGHSRGGYAACCALAYDHDISAVVSVSGIDSAMDAIMGQSQRYAGVLAYSNYGFLWLYQAMLFGPKTVNLQAHQQISQSQVPTLVVHGSSDDQVPADRFSIMSHREETGDNARFLIWTQSAHSGHTSLLFDEDGTANNELMEAIDRFLQKNLTERKG